MAGRYDPTRDAAFQRRKGSECDGALDRATQRALGRRGRPLLGQRELGVGSVGWDVAVLEFRLRRYGLGPRAVDGRFTRSTACGAAPLPESPRTRGGRHRRPEDLPLAPPDRDPRDPRLDEVACRPAGRELLLDLGAVPRQPVAARPAEPAVPDERDRPGPEARTPARRATLAPAAAGPDASRDAVRAAIDYWSRVYGVDPTLARALAWMESGFQQDVVSSVGALGVMQLLPETWEFVDVVLFGERTPRTYQGNVRAGVRYLRWQLDEFGGDVRLALAGWYQGARAVRERGLYSETKEFVRIVLALYGSV